MDRFLYHSGSIIESSQATLPVTNAGLLYGWGVFTTLRIYGGAVFALDRHWERITNHARRADIPVPITQDEAERILGDLIARNGTQNGRARVTLLKSQAGAWRLGDGLGSEVLIFTNSERTRSPREPAITVSPYRLLSHGPLAGVKRTAMLENLLALEEARSRGFSEAVMFNERGEAASATAANLFWADGDRLSTPSLATGAVPGITRGFVLEIGRKFNLPVSEGSFPVQRLLDASEVFLTSTARGIVPIASFDIKRYDSTKAWVTPLLIREFQKLVRTARISR